MLILRRLCKFSSQLKESTLTAISPLDGRYASQTTAIKDYFSEYALMKYRIKVEIEWLKFLHSKNMIKHGNSILNLTALDLTYLDLIYDKFDVSKSFRVKQIESTTNHDVKSIEYYIKEELDKNPILHSMKEYKVNSFFYIFAITTRPQLLVNSNNICYVILAILILYLLCIFVKKIPERNKILIIGQLLRVSMYNLFFEISKGELQYFHF